MVTKFMILCTNFSLMLHNLIYYYIHDYASLIIARNCPCIATIAIIDIMINCLVFYSPKYCYNIYNIME